MRNGCSWLPSPPPKACSTELSITAGVHASGLQTALTRSPKIRTQSLLCKDVLPKVVSLTLRSRPLATYSFTFPEALEWAQAGPKDTSDTPTGNATPAAPLKDRPKSTTRIKPPDDVIKLEDRLYYVLQPPLETVISSGTLTFPFTPFPYQFQGIAYLYSRHAAVLADEMGLGKTMQAISTVRMLLHSRELRNVLLICPKPLVTNWKREFTMWAPEIPISIIEGDQTRRRWQWQMDNTPVKVANYELLMRDRDLFEDDSLRFDLVILDEAQRIKNRNSATSEVVRSINRSRNWALTGTPVENSPEDLIGIFEFLAPGYLHSDMNYRQLGGAAKDYVLRRTKDKVLTELPPKLYRDADVELSPAQRDSYETAENEGILRLTAMGEELTIQNVFELVLRLKQICNFDPVTGDSSKLERLSADLDEVAASGKKAIIFSQWVKTLKHLEGPLARFNPLQYHGGIPSKKRDGILDRFKNDPDCSVIMMSYGAGSVGLNLQFCEYVFLYDRWWNPAVEDQAINRAHRIGAVGPVTVSRFLVTGTVEERIDEVLREKREMFDAIFSESGTPKKVGMTQDEIFGLFRLRTPQGPMGKAA